MKRRWKQTAGFTLVELIVVIAILGILAGVAVPTYSGYVKKANMAADQTLVDSINTAFAAACMEHGEDIKTVEIDDVAVAVGADKKLVVTKLVNDDVKVSFDVYWGANKDAQFKVVETSMLWFNTGTHMFEIRAENAGGPYAGLTFAKELLDRVKQSVFMTNPDLGVDNLMDRVDFVSSMAAGVADGSNAPQQMLNNYSQRMLAELGIVWPDNYDDLDPEEQEAVMAPLFDLVNAKIAMLDAQGGGGIEGWSEFEIDKKQRVAQNAILSTYAVLEAAKGMNGRDPAAVLNTISTTANYKDMLTNSDDEDGIAVAAAAYGLYTAYAYSLEVGTERDAAIARLDDPIGLMKGMDDPDFRTYLTTTQAQKDLDGYMAAMEMIDSSATDKEAVHSMIINGFTDPALLAVINQQMK